MLVCGRRTKADKWHEVREQKKPPNKKLSLQLSIFTKTRDYVLIFTFRQGRVPKSKVFLHTRITILDAGRKMGEAGRKEHCGNLINSFSF